MTILFDPSCAEIREVVLRTPCLRAKLTDDDYTELLAYLTRLEELITRREEQIAQMVRQNGGVSP